MYSTLCMRPANRYTTLQCSAIIDDLWHTVGSHNIVIDNNMLSFIYILDSSDVIGKIYVGETMNNM